MISILFKIARNFVDANDERKKYYGPADYFSAILKTFCLLYIHLNKRILQFKIIYYLLASTACNLSSKRRMILMFITLS